MDEIAALIEPLIPGLRRYAWVLLRDRGEADDLVQDCLERALTRWHLRRRDGNLRAWLFAIERNLFLDGMRRRRRRGPDVALDQAGEITTEHQDGRSALHDVLVALDLLPEEQRSTLLLVAVEELSYEDAAAILGVPVGTVMSRLSRARATLRRLTESPRGATLRSVG